MLIKHYRQVRFRVADPIRPGRTVFDERLDPSGTHQISHRGAIYDADAEGWFDVPEEVGNFLISFPGWRTPEQVHEEVVAGRIARDPADELPGPNTIYSGDGRSWTPGKGRPPRWVEEQRAQAR